LTGNPRKNIIKAPALAETQALVAHGEPCCCWCCCYRRLCQFRGTGKLTEELEIRNVKDVMLHRLGRHCPSMSLEKLARAGGSTTMASGSPALLPAERAKS